MNAHVISHLWVALKSECDVRGITIPHVDCDVIIPAGAVPEGIIVRVEIGVTLFGPFTFADNSQPVSPILWFCTQEEFEFMEPLTFRIRHALMEPEGVELSFAKAEHSSNTKRIVLIEENMRTSFHKNAADGRYYGQMSSKHCCFRCIQAKYDRSLSEKNGLYFSILSKKEDNMFNYEVRIACTFFLDTCIIALKEMFPNYESEGINGRFRFKKGATEPHLHVTIPIEDKSLQLTLKHKDKIFASDLDFWSNSDLKVMELMNKEKLYPPTIIIEAHSAKCQYAIIPVAIKGMETKAEGSDEVLFKIPKQFGPPTIVATATATVSSVCVTVPDKPLQLDSHFNLIYTTLCKSVASKWEHFGAYLDVKPTSIERIKAERDKDTQGCLGEVIKEWLKQRDPSATKSKIIEVLRELDLHTEADKLVKKL